MSAYLCSVEKFDLLASAYTRYPRKDRHLYMRRLGLPEVSASGLGQVIRDVLIEENWRSLNHLYGDDLGLWADQYAEMKAASHKLVIHLPAPGVIATVLEDVDYQSCEHPDYRNSAARRILDTISSDLLKYLPGYTY